MKPRRVMMSSGRVHVPYVITGTINKYFEHWDECRRAYTGQHGIRWQRVSSREEADAILTGRGVVLPPGLYAFTDGNGDGGVGLVVVRMANEVEDPQIAKEIASSVGEVLKSSAFSQLAGDAMEGAPRKSPSTLAEVCAVYIAVRELPEQGEATIVHDWVGVADWMEERVRAAKNPVVRTVVSSALELRKKKRLKLTFRRQPGHRSAWAGRHDFARFNKQADELADEGARGPR